MPACHSCMTSTCNKLYLCALCCHVQEYELHDANLERVLLPTLSSLTLVNEAVHLLQVCDNAHLKPLCDLQLQQVMSLCAML